ncbi:MAG: bifunctional glutamate N-acetyltransferase/amino-acid acetyltransferase ArgJ [Blastocatellia bacterium]
MKNKETNDPALLSVTAPKGFLAATTRCGLKKAGEDLAVIYSEHPATAAAVFTRNLVHAAPVALSREHLRNKTHRAFIVNAGCANACTGAEGMRNARATAAALARKLGCPPAEILVCSTGVIGMQLNMEKLDAGLETVTGQLSRDGGRGVAEAIMTTDTRPKRALKMATIGGRRITIGGVAKGAGMIHPNMATLLSFVTTDAAIGKPALQKALNLAVEDSFNRVSVDGDTSTNDTLAVLANGAAGNAPIGAAKGADFEKFVRALTDVCRALAIAVARDGEGARKLITIQVRNAPSRRDATRIAETISTSPLVKTAIAGSDANWGRILAAAGRSGAKFDPEKVDIRLGALPVCRRGAGLKFDEARAREILNREEVTLTIDLRQGDASVTAWTCDMTEDYIRINADYRS